MQRKLSKTLAALVLTSMAAIYTISPASAHPRHLAKNTTITVLPKAHKTIIVRKQRYHVHNGIFYRAAGNGYRVVATPIGLNVATLPVGFVTINLNGGRYYRHGNTYYRAAKRGFVVVARPKGVRVVVS